MSISSQECIIDENILVKIIIIVYENICFLEIKPESFLQVYNVENINITISSILIIIS